MTGFLGMGGMGAVYRASDAVLGKQVALKFVRGEVDRLREEVRLAQQVTHRNVCRTYDLETIDGNYLVKMEYIPGQTLAQDILTNGKMSIASAISISRAIADGLAAAHARGIVHRDLKPSNVMLDGERVVLMDFGLAQREGDASDFSGTIGYMSPEQLLGNTVDARSDLYALGCLAFEMLAGEPPFGMGSADEIAVRTVAMPPPDIRALRPEVPAWLARAIAGLLAKDPALRPKAAALLDGGPRSHKVALATLAVALVAAVGTWWGTRHGPAWEPQVADLPAFEENADGPSIAPDGKSFVFSSDRGHRDVWAIYLASFDRAEPRRISPAGEFCAFGRWSHDGRAVLMSCFIGGERRIIRQPLDGNGEVDAGRGQYADDCGDAHAVVVPRPTGFAIVLRSKDGHDDELVGTPGKSIPLARCDRSGQRIVYITEPIGQPNLGGDAVVVDRRGRAKRITDAGTVHDATFTPDGNAIVFSMQRDSRMSLFEVPADGGAIRELTPHEQYASAPDVSSDGRIMLFDRDRTSLPLFELTSTGAIQKTFRFEELFHVVPAPGGAIVVAARQDQREPAIVAIGLADETERTLTAGEPLFVTRDGRVVFRAPDDPRRLQAISLSGGPITTLATLSAPILNAVDGPDGPHVEIASGRLGEAWLVRPDGSAVPEGTAGLVIAAPAGGWRVVRLATESGVTLRFVAPGRPLSAIAFERAAALGQPLWVSDHEFAYCDHEACHRLDVTTGADLEKTRIDLPGNRPITVGIDGKRWFVTSYIGHVTRHAITNFADRPWH